MRVDEACTYVCSDLQLLQLWTESFVVAIVNSAKKMPYSMRCLARETFLAVQV
jgi:Ras GTPase-activating-like protein IQGAP2/3